MREACVTERQRTQNIQSKMVLEAILGNLDPVLKAVEEVA